ncbi:MAG: hypothetical protein JOY61_05075 [Chloroflexi bacterium]|nr:hypothetical protein [Chloroflexota bacterium]
MDFPHFSRPTVVGGRLVAASAVAATLTLASLAGGAPAFAQPVCNGSLHLDVGNPEPGDQLPPSKIILQGEAFDATAHQGSGVDRVYATLDDRDLGGRLLGDADLGQTNDRDFSLTADLSSDNGGHTLFFYAHSTVSDRWTQTGIPITVGFDQTSAGAPKEPRIGTSNQTDCASMDQPSVVLNLGNPSPGEALAPSTWVFTGRAYDRDAKTQQAPGVDRVYATIGDQNDGGLYLGEAKIDKDGNFNLRADLSGQGGRKMLYVYAHSSVNDSWGQVVLPIIITQP